MVTGWEMQRTEQGTVYYVDHISKRTSWEKPQMSSNGSNVIPAQKPDIRESLCQKSVFPLFWLLAILHIPPV